MPKVSFILPAYKRRFLKEAIDSILAQTCRDYELVIVDDKSPEGLYEVIGEYPWAKNFEAISGGGKKWDVDGAVVRYYQNEKNIGGKDLVAAWNHAMGYAIGEWCVLASDDDVYHVDYLSEMLRLQARYPQCDLFHCRIVVIDADGNWIKVGEQRIEYETQIQMAYSRGVLRFWQTAQEFMFRRLALEKCGGFISFPLAWYSDDATWMTLSSNGCACSPALLFRFRQSGENISSSYGDTVTRKCMAANMFKQWFLEFVNVLDAVDEEDRYLLNGLVEKVDCAVDNLTRLFVRGVCPFKQWRQVLRSTSMSKQLKLACICDRFRCLRAFRLLWVM